MYSLNLSIYAKIARLPQSCTDKIQPRSEKSSLTHDVTCKRCLHNRSTWSNQFTCQDNNALIIAKLMHYSLRIMNCQPLLRLQHEWQQHGDYNTNKELGFRRNKWSCKPPLSPLFEKLDLVDPHKNVHIRLKVKIFLHVYYHSQRLVSWLVPTCP